MQAPTEVDRASAPQKLGGGAQFWTYLSPQNDTQKLVTNWKVVLTQGNWTGEMSSGGASQLQTPGLSGEFQLEVTAIVGPNPEWQTLGPTEGSQPGVIGCNENCASMIGIVVDPNDPSKAYYWTTWDAFCS